MTQKELLTQHEFEKIDQALRRAARTAKKIAEQNNTPYVVVNKQISSQPKQINHK